MDPSKNPPPDWTQFRAVIVEMEALQASGAWDQHAFLRIRAKALQVLGDAAECIEAIDNEANAEWLDALDI